MSRYAMFFLMIRRSFIHRKSRVAISFSALAVGAAVISALISVYYDINIKMSKELRAYGANLVFVPAEGTMLPEERIEKILKVFTYKSVIGCTPSLYGLVRLGDKKAVIAGMWFDQVRKISPYWSLKGDWIENRSLERETLIGVAVAEKLTLRVGDEITLASENTNEKQRVKVKGIVSTGGTEDNQIFVNLVVAQRLLGQPGMWNVAYASVIGKSDELERKAREIGQEVPGVTARTIRKISHSEGAILNKIRSLMYLVVVVMLLSTLLCVGTTMMTTVMERRKEVGLRKALGAKDKGIIFEFLSEGILLGALGGLTGFGLGLLFAQIIGKTVFDSFISLRFPVLPLVFFSSVVVAALACLIPVRMAAGVEPAIVLRGE